MNDVYVSCKDVEDFGKYVSRTDISKVFHTSELSGRTHHILIDGKEQKEITIPESVTSIGQEAFYGCKGLSTIYSRPTVPPTCGTNDFDSSIYSSAVLYVPNKGNAFTRYSGLSPWNNFRDIRETAFPDGDDDYNPEWDVNKDGKFDIQDVTFLINKLVKK